MPLAMIRKAATAILVLALLLVGFKPMTDIAMAAAMGMQQPCCADCEQPMSPDDGPCGVMGGCALAPSFTPPPSTPGPAVFPTRLILPLADQAVAASADSTPPFRPPRS
jgi:hypothetical protein